jgi:CubicO group peptidase (beta-lactamase class C family)
VPLLARALLGRAGTCAIRTSRGAVDALFADLRQGVQPGAAVLVVRDGQIVHQAAYGYADVERRIPLTIESTFRLDSVSKQFTSMAVMLLAEDGKLAYDDPVSRYVPALATYPGVTIRHLLTHTGGLPEYYDVIDTAHGWPSNADAARLLGQMAKPVFAPGTRYEYSNPGYDMLAQVVEGASGKRFADFVRERIFVPLRMSHSLVHDHTRPEVPRRVLGYDRAASGFEPQRRAPAQRHRGLGRVFTTLGRPVSLGPGAVWRQAREPCDPQAGVYAVCAHERRIDGLRFSAGGSTSTAACGASTTAAAGSDSAATSRVTRMSACRS